MVKPAESSVTQVRVESVTSVAGNTGSKKRKRDPDATSEDIAIFNEDPCDSSDSEEKHDVDLDNASAGRRKKSKKRKTKAARTEADVRRENVNRIRNSHRIHIWGVDIPDPINSFMDLPQDTIVMKNLIRHGYTEPTAVQMQAIPILLAERELLACAPTGSGKTFAFLVPLIMNLQKPKDIGFRAVIVVPTLELAHQIYKDCLRLSEGTKLKTFMIDKQDFAEEKFKSMSKCDILVTTPNRLIYTLKAGAISLKNVTHLIVDECDRLFEGGFRDQLGAIYSACDSAFVRRSFFSATCTYEVEEFCKSHLENPIVMYIGSRNAAVSLIQQDLIFAGTETGKLTSFRNLIREGIEPPVLVFVQSQDRADELLIELLEQGLKVKAIHAGKPQEERESTIESFRQGKIWILVCTTVLSRGIDFPAVKLVVNYDLPQSPIEYIHSVGRTGRAGRAGRAVTFFTEDDRDNLRRIAQVLENSGFPVPPYVHQLPKLRKDKKAKNKFRVPKRAHILRRPKYNHKRKKRRLDGTEVPEASTVEQEDRDTIKNSAEKDQSEKPKVAIKSKEAKVNSKKKKAVVKQRRKGNTS